MKKDDKGLVGTYTVMLFSGGVLSANSSDSDRSQWVRLRHMKRGEKQVCQCVFVY